MRFLFLIFIIVPIIEITVLINVGEMIGTWNTVGLVLLSAFIGVNMLRYQGISTLTRAQARMQSGEMPANEMIEGIILAVGGALLVTPGFVTDMFGFCCLIPFTRRWFVSALRGRFVTVSSSHFYQQQGPAEPEAGAQRFEPHRQPRSDRGDGSAAGKGRNQGNTYDGEYHRED